MQDLVWTCWVSILFWSDHPCCKKKVFLLESLCCMLCPLKHKCFWKTLKIFYSFQASIVLLNKDKAKLQLLEMITYIKMYTKKAFSLWQIIPNLWVLWISALSDFPLQSVWIKAIYKWPWHWIDTERVWCAWVSKCLYHSLLQQAEILIDPGEDASVKDRHLIKSLLH